MSEHEVRLAGPGDAAVLGRLLHRFNSEYEEETPDAETLAEHYGTLLDTGEVVALLAGDGPDGFVQFRLKTSHYTGEPDAYIEELWVAPDRRGQGLGRALLEAAMEAARERGATHIDLTTSEADTEALGLYASAGFTNREGRPDGPVMLYYERDL
jgi:ribosomal protein S18 acetylase RimI-like enzyme